MGQEDQSVNRLGLSNVPRAKLRWVITLGLGQLLAQMLLLWNLEKRYLFPQKDTTPSKGSWLVD
jgi:hypothetical protein